MFNIPKTGLKPTQIQGRGKIFRNSLWVILALGIIFFAYSSGLFEPLKNQNRPVDCLGKDDRLAPMFTLPDLNGEEVHLSAYKGKVILIDFWATWCGPCRQVILHLNELHHRYKDDGLVVIGISLDRGNAQSHRKTVRNWVEKHGVEYINVLGNEAVMDAYSEIPGLGPIHGIPTTFIIDRQGRICGKFVGLTAPGVLEEAIKKNL